MIPLVIHHLWFTVEATTPIILPAESGPAIRGALVSALRRHYCPDATLRPAGAGVEADPGHRSICPVCWLVAAEDSSAERGQNIPRPYTIEPPSRSGRIEPGEELSFGVSLIGKALNLFPYLVLAVPEMGRAGVGRFDPQQKGRGRFHLRSVSAINPLSGARQELLGAGSRLHLPAIPVDSQRIADHSAVAIEQARTRDNCVEVRFWTPTRIIQGSHLVRDAAFSPLIQRLLERLEALLEHFGGSKMRWEGMDRTSLLAMADAVDIVDDDIEWVEVISGSQRLGRATPVSGFRGRVVYRATDWTSLLPFLLWGQSVHVGKNAVKGNGWFTVEGCPGWQGLAQKSDAAASGPATRS